MIPKEYQEVEYLETDGKQYIDTSVIPENGFGFFADFMPLTDVDTIASSKLMGSSKYNNGMWGGIEISTYQSTSGGQMTWFKRNTWYDPGFKSYTRVQLSNINNHYHSSTGKDYQTPYSTSSEIYKTLYLLSINSDRGSVTGAGSRLWLCKLYNNDKIIANFIPCYRKSDEKPGMYDTVRKIFLTNQGIGEFICGPAVYNALLRETNGLEMKRRRAALKQIYAVSKPTYDYRLAPPIGDTDTGIKLFDADKDFAILTTYHCPNMTEPSNTAPVIKSGASGFASMAGSKLGIRFQHMSNSSTPNIAFMGYGRFGPTFGWANDFKPYSQVGGRTLTTHRVGVDTAVHELCGVWAGIAARGTFTISATDTLHVYSCDEIVIDQIVIYFRELTADEEENWRCYGKLP